MASDYIEVKQPVKPIKKVTVIVEQNKCKYCKCVSASDICGWCKEILKNYPTEVCLDIFGESVYKDAEEIKRVQYHHMKITKFSQKNIYFCQILNLKPNKVEIVNINSSYAECIIIYYGYRYQIWLPEEYYECDMHYKNRRAILSQGEGVCITGFSKRKVNIAILGDVN